VGGPLHVRAVDTGAGLYEARASRRAFPFRRPDASNVNLQTAREKEGQTIGAILMKKHVQIFSVIYTTGKKKLFLERKYVACYSQVSLSVCRLVHKKVFDHEMSAT
jgi:hypothetical protein